MCEICHRYYCPATCPNAPDPPRVYVCSGCGGDILEGDQYWEIMGEQWCECCIDDARKTAEYNP